MTSEEAALADFASTCNVSTPDVSYVDKAGTIHLAIHVGAINAIYASSLEQVRRRLKASTWPEDLALADRIFLKEVRPKSWLQSRESELLQSLLSESLTIGRNSLNSSFHRQAKPYLAGKEQQINNDANHVVFGRRGAGKSTLILHACNRARDRKLPFCWLSIQQYHGRSDYQVIPQCLHEIATEIAKHPDADGEHMRELLKEVYALESVGNGLTFDQIKQALPRIARRVLPLVERAGRLYIFVDDLHVLSPELQPYLLSILYSIARGNNIFLKITAIENLTVLYNDRTREGMQTPGDAQVVRLDYNLVDPESAYNHIAHIVDTYVRYVGIPSARTMCYSEDVLLRLTWVSAGVPRDALYIFNNSIGRARASRRRRVAVTDVNLSAGEAMTEKERLIAEDVQGGTDEMRRALDDIRRFCRQEKKNAFLVKEDRNDPGFQMIHKLSDLRFIHILSAGITPERAGERYEVYLLDYAFYTGYRRAPGIEEVVSTRTLPAAKKMRKLPCYDYRKRLDG